MKKISVLLLYSLPAPFFPDGTPDKIGQESVLSRLRAVEESLQRLGHPVQTLHAKGEIGSLIQGLQAARPDLVFNLCEEYQGETHWEMNVAALLELMEIPFTGSSAFILGLSQDKGKTKSIMAQHGIPTPAYRVGLPGKEELGEGLRFPLIVKPLREDASLGIDNEAVVGDEKALAKRVQKVFRDYGQPALIEEYIDGRELNVSILGNADARPMPISEIDFSSLPAGIPRICGYAAKWVEASPEFTHTVPRCPADLPAPIEKRVLDVALRSFHLLECRDYARVDIRLSSDGVPYVLEINANPDISPDAGMSRSSLAAGYSYHEFIGRIVEIARARTVSPRVSRRTKKASPEKEP